jgi:signal peptidase I
MNGLAQTTLKRRRAWLAALLSLFLPGLGQLYNRHARLALTFIVVALLASIPGRWLVAAVPSEAVAAVAAIVVSVSITTTLFAIIQAAIGAKRAGAIAPAWFNRWYVYVGLLVLVAACQGVARLLPISNIASYSIPSYSNVPTLLVGDNFVARTRAFSARLPDRGDLAVFPEPGTPGDVFWVKRVVGLPGDTIQLVEGILNINGSPVQRSRIDDYIDPSDPQRRQVPQYVETLPGGAAHRIIEAAGDAGHFDNTQAYVVPDSYVFVLGDNRDQSNDSRSVGFIPISSLMDRPLFIYWSADLSRIGKVLE